MSEEYPEYETACRAMDKALRKQVVDDPRDATIAQQREVIAELVEALSESMEWDWPHEEDGTESLRWNFEQLIAKAKEHTHD